MASLSPPPFLFFSFLFFLLLIPSSSSSVSSSITLSLTPLPLPTQQPQFSTSSTSWQEQDQLQMQMLNHLATSSLARAHHLKRPTKITANANSSLSSSSITKVPVFSHSYGAYTVDLSFGTPSQTLTFVMDTGSSLVWFPCTSRYSCADCSFPGSDPTKSRPFIPKFSSSARILGCKSPKCGWLFGSDPTIRCRDCDPASKKNCSEPCPPYSIQYGSGATAGLLLSDKLFVSGKTVPDFLVGCSIISIRQPAGIAGLGRGPESLPAQMGLHRFSYCLQSRKFDDTGVTSDLILESGSGHGKSGDEEGLSYTPFHKSPALGGSAFQSLYYLNLRKIMVGDKAVKVPYKYLVPGGPEGNGGSIIDSGTTFTFMEKPVFEAVASEFEKQMGANYSRATEVEAKTGLRPCFNVSSAQSLAVPELAFRFKGGAKLVLPVENYFLLVGRTRVLCAAIVTSNALGPQGSGGGPAIILGGFQQQNYHVVYDLENDRLGFRKQTCK